MTTWEYFVIAVLGISVLAVILFSVIRPSARVRLGIFFERELDHAKEEEKEPPVDEAPTEIVRRDDAW